MLVPGQVGRWITRRPPEDWSAGDHLFMWRGAPRAGVVGLARLERVEPELWQSLEEHLYGEGVTAVEWAERLPVELRDGGTLLRFELDANDAERTLEVTTTEERLASALRAA